MKVDNVKISKFSELRGQLTAKRPGESVDITIDRDGDVLTKSVKLTKRIKSIIVKTFGWELKNLTKEEIKKNTINGGVKIVNTRDPKNDLSGFIITKVNTKNVTNAEETAILIDQLSNYRDSTNIIEMINLQGERERYRF